MSIGKENSKRILSCKTLCNGSKAHLYEARKANKYRPGSSPMYFFHSDSVGFWPHALNTSPICQTWTFWSPLLSKMLNVSWYSKSKKSKLQYVVYMQYAHISYYNSTSALIDWSFHVPCCVLCPDLSRFSHWQTANLQKWFMTHRLRWSIPQSEQNTRCK